jgi:hypothetical protein
MNLDAALQGANPKLDDANECALTKKDPAEMTSTSTLSCLHHGERLQITFFLQEHAKRNLVVLPHGSGHGLVKA